MTWGQNRSHNFVCFSCRNNKKLPQYSRPICQFCQAPMPCVYQNKTPTKTDDKGWNELHQKYLEWARKDAEEEYYKHIGWRPSWNYLMFKLRKVG